ncbi:MaoC family dehydratase [Natronomonas sp. EA1]|uniref:MaoC family dehydratase n=1 Tax=Natronomonas sp. EA1 TaxID=3421655 RepID=UPI003EB6D7D4
MSTTSHPLFDMWSRTSTVVLDAMLEANRATAAAFGVSVDAAEPAETISIEPDSDLEEWTVERQIAGPEPTVGDSVRFAKTLTEADVGRFALASGDTNPIHLDREWARESRFDGRIVHGTLVAGLISAALARLPGSVIYLSQELEFQAPVRLGDEVTAEVEIVEDLGHDRFRLRTTVLKGETIVIDGEAVVLIDDLPA